MSLGAGRPRMFALVYMCTQNYIQVPACSVNTIASSATFIAHVTDMRDVMGLTRFGTHLEREMSMEKSHNECRRAASDCNHCCMNASLRRAQADHVTCESHAGSARCIDHVSFTTDFFANMSDYAKQLAPGGRVGDDGLRPSKPNPLSGVSANAVLTMAHVDESMYSHVTDALISARQYTHFYFDS